MRITDEYRELNRVLHAEKNGFGNHGRDWAPQIEQLAELMKTTSILDYGCGKGSLAFSLPGLPIREYDPAVRSKDAEPDPADLVVCCDVLEHIEPECMNDVLAHLMMLTKRLFFATVSTRPAIKNLPDGRNAHISLHDVQWWLDKLNSRFVPIQYQLLGETFFIIARSLGEHARVKANGGEP